MSTSSRFTVALHILTWMALVSRQREIVTSDQIAASVNTNPVFIRRILGLLEKAHLVTVQHGTGAGWKLAHKAEEISLLDVFQAVEQAPLFEMHHSQPNQACPVGRGIQPALKGFYENAENALKQQLAQTTIADVLQETLTFA
ncbi:Rrf2 family transcriptional regulator [Ktedonosporobacter rubrisoli]|uniref:Rrf2 family transcriptional regulator n=1 Tax=Ktedonosporobacter rubrisoli TaxID=2509675 RepID=A0A4P6K2E1_KTERU|nr:Rrf2 family transcriptional regulator [Ktedonosporobacter rubrisoli]QBD82377.1 Rrf2 family transcriptional regulator [Ktedonosporobacter rubrisoli]